MPQSPPLVAITLGDVAGIGPEVIVRAWGESRLRDIVRPLVIGDSEVLRRAARQFAPGLEIQTVREPDEASPSNQLIPCLDATDLDLSGMIPGEVDARAGHAAFQFLNRAIDLALEGRVDAITTLPLNKQSLRLGGHLQPGHTEILAERCGVPRHAMMLYLPPEEGGASSGLGVVHATLHVALRAVFDLLTPEVVSDAIALADQSMRPLTGGRSPRIGVAGLNPHAGENGLFGDEESTIITPAVASSRDAGCDVQGPVAADTLFARALGGEFDAVVAMYHDQGHVALKTIGFDRCVNVTLGLPIVRTSVAHGTAFDIVGRGLADTSSLISAARVAAQLVSGRQWAIGEAR